MPVKLLLEEEKEKKKKKNQCKLCTFNLLSFSLSNSSRAQMDKSIV